MCASFCRGKSSDKHFWTHHELKYMATASMQNYDCKTFKMCVIISYNIFGERYKQYNISLGLVQFLNDACRNTNGPISETIFDTRTKFNNLSLQWDFLR